tara:strand:- start:9636 stop:9809 length:174 start_codon:yes stop_codon:yes gene_type:complete
MSTQNNKYQIVFAYGGLSIGDVKRTVEVNGKDQEEALNNFKERYNYEVIVSCEELKS